MTFVKICGVTNLDDARLAVDACADALGFIFAASKRHVTIDQVAAITRAVTDVMTVGVFRDQSVEEVVDILESVDLHAAQLHDYSAHDIEEIRSRTSVKVIRAIPFDSSDLLTADQSGADHVLIDAPVPGSGQSFDWSNLDGITYPYVLAGGLNADNVGAAIAELHPWGVDAVSGTEAAPGIKDPAKLRAFVTAAKR